MKTDKQKDKAKFDLEKMEVAKLKNMRLIVGGKVVELDDPIDTNHQAGKSTANCQNFF